MTSSSFPFTSAEVKAHLKDLGYDKVSERQLEEFIRDLRRLIKYEDKQRRLKRADDRTRTRSPDSSSAYGSSNSLDEADQGRAGSPTKRRRRARQKEEHSSPVKTRRTVSAAASSRKVANYVGPPAVTSPHSSTASTEAEVVIRVLRDDNAQREKRSSRRTARPSHIPAKPTTSFIRPARPASAGGRSLKTDPVRLHSFYQSLWAKRAIPGEDARKSTRWAVREWMLGAEANAPKVNGK